MLTEATSSARPWLRGQPVRIEFGAGMQSSMAANSEPCVSNLLIADMLLDVMSGVGSTVRHLAPPASAERELGKLARSMRLKCKGADKNI